MDRGGFLLNLDFFPAHCVYTQHSLDLECSCHFIKGQATSWKVKLQGVDAWVPLTKLPHPFLPVQVPPCCMSAPSFSLACKHANGEYLQWREWNLHRGGVRDITQPRERGEIVQEWIKGHWGQESAYGPPFKIPLYFLKHLTESVA